MKIKRKQFEKCLKSVQAGLARREIMEQSQCFVFSGGRVSTFNDEVAAWADSPLDVEGAVQADKLLALLGKVTDEEVEVESKDDGLAFRGKKWRSVVRMEREVVLPVSDVERPDDWEPVPEGLMEGLRAAASCCSRDESHFVMTCVNVAEKWVEATDDVQILRWLVDTGVTEPMLVRGESISKIESVGAKEWSRTDGWLHFRSGDGVVLSCRRAEDEFPDVGRFLAVEGQSFKFPEDLSAVLDKARVFSSEQMSGDLVTVALSKGKLSISGEGPGGWYEERRKSDYEGDAFRFLIEPSLLVTIAARSPECLVSDGRLMIDGGKFVYAACTSVPEGE